MIRTIIMLSPKAGPRTLTIARAKSDSAIRRLSIARSWYSALQLVLF